MLYFSGFECCIFLDLSVVLFWTGMLYHFGWSDVSFWIVVPFWVRVLYMFGLECFASTFFGLK